MIPQHKKHIDIGASESTMKPDIMFKTGKNKFNIKNAVVFACNNAYYSIENDTFKVTSYNYWARAELLVKVEPGKTYTLSTDITNNATDGYHCNISLYNTRYDRFYGEGYITEASGRIHLTFTPDAGEEYILVLLYSNASDNATTNTVTFSNIQLEEGNYDTAYEPYVDNDILFKDRYKTYQSILPNDIFVGSYKPENNERMWVRKGKNLIDLSRCTAVACTINSDGSFTSNIQGTYYSNIYVNYLAKTFLENKGKTVTLSIGKVIDSQSLTIVIYGDRGNGSTYQEANDWNTSKISIKISEDFINITQIELRFNRKNTTFTDTSTTIPYMQLEWGSEATTYEPYIDTELYVNDDTGTYTRYDGVVTIQNANGIALRYPDGTQICRADIVHDSVSCTTAYGACYYGELQWDYPAPFIDVPEYSAGQLNWGGVGGCSPNTIGTHYTRFFVYNMTNYARSNAEMRYFAIGKWK